MAQGVATRSGTRPPGENTNELHVLGWEDFSDLELRPGSLAEVL
jgi:hypothetical protein